jgi:Sortase domain
MIATGVVLVGLAIGQHHHRDDAIAAEAARKAQVDRAAVLEAQQFRAMTRPQSHQAPQTRQARQTGLAPQPRLAPRTQTREAPPTHGASQSHQANVGAEVDQAPLAAAQPAGEAQQVRAKAPALLSSHQVGVRAASGSASAARPRASDVAAPGAVIRGAGATLVIPALQVRAPIVPTGAVDGSMAIPADIHTVGWYDGIDSIGGTATSAPTPFPGQSGVSLLAGHVDWSGEGPGALYYIGQLVVGDPVEVVGSNGGRTYWRVSQPPITVSKAELPADLFVNSGPPKLALVTCGGPFDATTHHYLDNVIVWATLVAR